MSDDDFKITISTEHITKGDVFFCFSEAEKYLSIDIINKTSSIYAIKGFCKRIVKSLNIKDRKKKLFYKKVFEYKNAKVLKQELVKQLQKKYKYEPKFGIVAITGTKGKTTTAWYILQMLSYCGIRCGYIGTLGVYLGVDEKINKNNILTTPNIDEMYFYIDSLIKRKVMLIVIEASSHALQQGRIDGLKIDYACFTNFSQGHLDYHKTMEKYFLSKSMLFSKYLKSDGYAVINKTDPKSSKIEEICKRRSLKTIKIGFNNECDIKILSINFNSVSFFVKKTKEMFNVENSNIIGEFNMLNMLEAFAISNLINFKYKKQVNLHRKNNVLFKKLLSPSGRMEKIKDTNIFVDFAHTPKSFEEILKLLKLIYKEVYVVFGCGGDRDKQKRPIMFEIAKNIADFIVITNDNPRTEEPKKIIEDITCFARNDDKNLLFNDKFVKNEIKKIQKRLYDKYHKYKFKIIENRREAIKYTICNFFKKQSKGCILIAGKGNEDYQIIGRKKIHFNDREEVEKIIKKY